MKKVLALAVSLIFALSVGIAFAEEPAGQTPADSGKKEEKAPAKKKKKKASKKKTDKKEAEKAAEPAPAPAAPPASGGYK